MARASSLGARIQSAAPAPAPPLGAHTLGYTANL